MCGDCDVSVRRRSSGEPEAAWPEGSEGEPLSAAPLTSVPYQTLTVLPEGGQAQPPCTAGTDGCNSSLGVMSDPQLHLCRVRSQNVRFPSGKRGEERDQI